MERRLTMRWTDWLLLMVGGVMAVALFCVAVWFADQVLRVLMGVMAWG